MSTTETFDYQMYMKEQAPDASKVQHGPQARQSRRQMAKHRITIRIDADVLEEFKHLVPEGRGYQGLMNQALREWLAAQNINELVRKELKVMTAEVVESVREHTHPEQSQ